MSRTPVKSQLAGYRRARGIVSPKPAFRRAYQPHRQGVPIGLTNAMASGRFRGPMLPPAGLWASWLASITRAAQRRVR